MCRSLFVIPLFFLEVEGKRELKTKYRTFLCKNHKHQMNRGLKTATQPCLEHSHILLKLVDPAPDGEVGAPREEHLGRNTQV